MPIEKESDLIQSLRNYLDGKLSREQQEQMRYRLRVEPRLAEYLKSITVTQNLEKFRGAVSRNDRVRARSGPSSFSKFNLWISDTPESAFLKAVTVLGNSYRVLRPLSELHQSGLTAFAVHVEEDLRRVLFIPENPKGNGGVPITIAHYGNLPIETELEVEEGPQTVNRHQILPNETLKILIRPGKTLLTTIGTQIPNTTLVLT